MNSKVLKTLEFNKIKETLASQAYSQRAKGLCKALAPLNDLYEIQKAQAQTTAAVSLLRKKHTPAFNPLKDITPHIRRLDVGSFLNASELLDIAGNLEVCASIKKFLEPGPNEEIPEAFSYYYSELEPCEDIRFEIKRCIISPDEIADDASFALKDIRRQKVITASKVSKTLNSLITSQSMKTYLQDSLVPFVREDTAFPLRQNTKIIFPA